MPDLLWIAAGLRIDLCRCCNAGSTFPQRSTTVPDLLCLAPGLRIDPDMNSGGRMSYYTGLSIVDMTDDLVLPAPREATTPITGYPEGFWINLVSWSQDGKHIAFTVRSPGESVSLTHQPPVASCQRSHSALQWKL